MTPPEQDSPLAAMISAVADGHLLTALDKAQLRLAMVGEALGRGLTWAQVGAVYGKSGREMKREVHRLEVKIRRLRRMELPVTPGTPSPARPSSP